MLLSFNFFCLRLLSLTSMVNFNNLKTLYSETMTKCKRYTCIETEQFKISIVILYTFVKLSLKELSQLFNFSEMIKRFSLFNSNYLNLPLNDLNITGSSTVDYY